LAAELRVERSTVVRWESGEREPSPWVRPKLAKALRLTLQELDALLVEPARQEVEAKIDTGRIARPEHADTDDMHRRELLRLFSTAGAVLALRPFDDSPNTVGLDGYGEFNDHLWRVFGMASAKADVLPLVRRHLTVLSIGLTESQGPVPHRRLCAFVGDLFQLAGEIFFDADAYTDAAHCYTLAAQAAREAGAFDLWPAR
jgi:transcriptional regulator with XRE-family HTH domain